MAHRVYKSNGKFLVSTRSILLHFELLVFMLCYLIVTIISVLKKKYMFGHYGFKMNLCPYRWTITPNATSLDCGQFIWTYFKWAWRRSHLNLLTLTLLWLEWSVNSLYCLWLGSLVNYPWWALTLHLSDLTELLGTSISDFLKCLAFLLWVVNLRVFTFYMLRL